MTSNNCFKADKYLLSTYVAQTWCELHYTHYFQEHKYNKKRALMHFRNGNKKWRFLFLKSVLKHVSLSSRIEIALNVGNGKKLVFFFTHLKKSPFVSTINTCEWLLLEKFIIFRTAHTEGHVFHGVYFWCPFTFSLHSI